MMTDALALFTMVRASKATARELEGTHVPEPEFKPFRFPREEATVAPVRPITPAHVAREPRTLEELGLPGSLAREIEASFRLMGLTRGDRVVGYTFTPRDGASHALRLATAPGSDATGLAA